MTFTENDNLIDSGKLVNNQDVCNENFLWLCINQDRIPSHTWILHGQSSVSIIISVISRIVALRTVRIDSFMGKYFSLK